MSLADFGKVIKFNAAKAKEYLVQWEELCRCEDGRLWGVNLRMPFVIIHQETRELVANEEGFGDKYPEELVITATGFEYQGKHWASAPWNVVETLDEKERMKLLVHEAFHALQPSLFGKDCEDIGNNAHLEELDARVLFIVEMNALLAALKCVGEERIRAARAALFARAQRREKYGAMAEAIAEVVEGTAVYTEKMLVEPDRILEDMEAEVISVCTAGHNLPAYMGYLSGAMYCFVLDAFGIVWKPGLTYNSDLGELLGAEIGIPQAFLSTLNEYGYNEILEEEKKKTEDRKQKLRTIVEAFESRPILRSFEKGSKGIFGQKIEIAGFGEVLRGVVQYIGEFGKMIVNDGNLEKSVTSGGDLDFLIHNEGYCAVFADNIRHEDNKIFGDYWELELNEGFILVAEDGNYEIKKA